MFGGDALATAMCVSDCAAGGQVRCGRICMQRSAVLLGMTACGIPIIITCMGCIPLHVACFGRRCWWPRFLALQGLVMALSAGKRASLTPLTYSSQVLVDADVLRQLTPADLDACKALLLHMGDHVVKGEDASQALYQVSTRTVLHAAACACARCTTLAVMRHACVLHRHVSTERPKWPTLGSMYASG